MPSAPPKLYTHIEERYQKPSCPTQRPERTCMKYEKHRASFPPVFFKKAMEAGMMGPELLKWERNNRDELVPRPNAMSSYPTLHLLRSGLSGRLACPTERHPHPQFSSISPRPALPPPCPVRSSVRSSQGREKGGAETFQQRVVSSSLRRGF